MAKAKKKIQTKSTPNEKYQHTLKHVTSDTCIICKQKCKKGIEYIEKMSVPGSIGKGVPCHLTKGKGIK
ncbi:hypothetical protein [Alkalihalobacillus trypoxylicola]|uniref:Uncharacterized protein n=1 Tax=Alkalihalobacillus trypoxylicola TaxID=519424 RepID=A0A162F643_9BACI|nr:hypothetical protein [Alkalihalobacillus trypoxylicola]KYG34865.1 hypothetical protein AZF04_00595 [Alkalihalobacillus trypoxylicola]GAF66808.1 hypothetical protein BTS2_3712 [Bacillus sp. TS-2]